MAKKEEKKENINYYSNNLAFEKIEEVDIQKITIPPDFLDDSKDTIETAEQEDYADFNDFEDMQEDLENLGFEGKTQEELQDFIMQKLTGNMEQFNSEKTPADEEIEITLEELMAQEGLIKKETEEANTETTTEAIKDIEEKTEQDKKNIQETNYALPEEAPMSMFQMSEEETQKALENAQTEFATQKTEKIETEEETKELEEDAVFHDPFEEYKSTAKKKYVFSVHQKYAFTIDEIPVEDREEYIEHAIQLKMDADNNEKIKHKKIDLVVKIIIIIATIIIGTPVAFKAVNWSVDSTIQNYEYCQKSFEKLFKKRFSVPKKIY